MRIIHFLQASLLLLTANAVYAQPLISESLTFARAMDFLGTRGKSVPYDGVYWIEQVRSRSPKNNFQRARVTDSDEISLPM